MPDEQREKLHTTVSQTVGPYFNVGLGWLFTDRAVPLDTAGATLVVQGRVIDGLGAPVADALLETWQADENGLYDQPDNLGERAGIPRISGFARVPTDEQGSFRLVTTLPGRVAGPDGHRLQAPHISVAIFMRGLLRHAVTRIYFASDPANEADPVLERVPAARRHTLLARKVSEAPTVFEWNIVLQGRDETVFFDV